MLQLCLVLINRLEKFPNATVHHKIHLPRDETHCLERDCFLTETACCDTIIASGIELISRGEKPDVPSDTVGMLCGKGARLIKPKSGKGERAVVINVLFALPESLSEEEVAMIMGLAWAGAVKGALKNWAAAKSTWDYHGNFTDSTYL